MRAEFTLEISSNQKIVMTEIFSMIKSSKKSLLETSIVFVRDLREVIDSFLFE